MASKYKSCGKKWTEKKEREEAKAKEEAEKAEKKAEKEAKMKSKGKGKVVTEAEGLSKAEVDAYIAKVKADVDAVAKARVLA